MTQPVRPHGAWVLLGDTEITPLQARDLAYELLRAADVAAAYHYPSCINPHEPEPKPRRRVNR